MPVEERPLRTEEIRSRLQAARDEVVAELARARVNARPVELDQARIGRLARVDALQGQAMARETERRCQAERARIEAALGRLAAGTYGLCVRCEEPVAAGRLKADPAAALCLACAASR